MSATVACIADGKVHRQWQAGRIGGESLGRKSTPFGHSGEIFLVDGDAGTFYLLPRHEGGKNRPAPRAINSRANMYALKDLGVQQVLAWGPGGAITHNIAIGDLVILNDLIDMTFHRERTFFENSPLGFLRQFPVFCPAMSNAISEALESMKLLHSRRGIVAVTEGPRLETPAEVRYLATVGAEVVAHTFVPEVFLAKELEMCYAAVCYIVNYAETGSRHRPFMPGDLFGGLTQKSESDRLSGVLAAISRIVRNVAIAVEKARIEDCECSRTMAANIREYDLSDDWHDWFE